MKPGCCPAAEASMREAVKDANAARQIAGDAQSTRIRAQRRSAALEDRLRLYVQAQCTMHSMQTDADLPMVAAHNLILR